MWSFHKDSYFYYCRNFISICGSCVTIGEECKDSKRNLYHMTEGNATDKWIIIVRVPKTAEIPVFTVILANELLHLKFYLTKK